MYLDPKRQINDDRGGINRVCVSRGDPLETWLYCYNML